MGDTSIEWTDKSWNPIAAFAERNGKRRRGWMCSKPSAGCRGCYAERRNKWIGNGLAYTPENVKKVEWELVGLDEPSTWKSPQTCFVQSMGDLFHEAIPDEMIGRVWSKMLEFPQHKFQVLTKRASRMRELVLRFKEEAAQKGLNSDDHIWLGVSVENQEQADERIPELLKIPAAVRFLSCEPLLGQVNLSLRNRQSTCPTCKGEGRILDPSHSQHPSQTGDGEDQDWCLDCSERDENREGIHWVIVGGESGPGARPMEIEWARSLRDQCQGAGVPFFMKQGSQANWPEYKNFDSFPADLRVREFPTIKATR